MTYELMNTLEVSDEGINELKYETNDTTQNSV